MLSRFFKDDRSSLTDKLQEVPPPERFKWLGLEKTPFHRDD